MLMFMLMLASLVRTVLYRQLVQTELKLAKGKEVVTTAELETEIRKANEKSNALLTENAVLKDRCEELYSKWMECKAKKEESIEDLAEANTKIDSLCAENESLDRTLTLEIVAKP